MLPFFGYTQSNQLRGNTNIYESEPEIDLFNESNNNLKLSPNPSNGIFHFDNSNFDLNEVNMLVYNCIGQKVFETRMSLKDNNSIDLGHLLKGVYLISFDSDSKKITKKIIIN